jgi:hypothetical protein
MGTEGRGRGEELGVVRENEELEKRMLCERTMGRKGLKKLGVV